MLSNNKRQKKIYHSPHLIHLDIADPSSVQDARHTNGLARHWLDYPTAVRRVFGSISVGSQNFSSFHARDMVNIISFLAS